MHQTFFVRHDKLLKQIRPDDVICLYTEVNCTRIYLTDKTFYRVRTTLSKALKKLPADIFLKILHSFAACVHYNNNLDRDHLMVGDEPLLIGRPRYRALINELKIIG